MKSFWRHHKFLSLSVLALLIFIPFFLALSYDENSGFPAPNGGAFTRVFHNKADGTKDPVGACIYNPSSYSYFVPTRTLAEWNAFVNSLSSLGVGLLACCGDGVCTETPASCPQDCEYLCDYRPAGIYTSAIYSSSENCGHTPGCAFNYPSGQTPNPLPQVFGSREGGGCGYLQKRRYSQCASLIRPSFSICDGDPCITGVEHATFETPQFCVGHYEHSTRRCIYTNKISKPLPSWGASVYIDNYPSYNNGSYGFNTNPYFNGGSSGSWGVCYTASAPCGDGICSAGESCFSCSNDCGACPIVCGDGVCSYGQESCDSCSSDCGECTCADHTDEYSCQQSGCSWDYNNYTCGDPSTSCSNYYDDYSCSQAGCSWNYGNSTCNVAGGTNCADHYDEYSCGSAGCYWDYSYWKCKSYNCSNYYDQYSCQQQGCDWGGYCY